MIKFLKSQSAGVAIFCFALLTQLNHAQNVALLHSKGKGFDVLSSWGIAFALETTVLYAVINSQRNFSYVFAGMSILINVAYYESFMKAEHSMWFWSDLFDNWPKWLFSIIVPVAIAFYSHVLVKFVEETKSINSENGIYNFWLKVKSIKFWGKDEKVEVVPDSVDISSETVVREVDDFTSKNHAVPVKEKHQAILRFLEENGPATCGRIVKGTGIAPVTLKNKEGGYLAELESQHLIKPYTEGARTFYTLNGSS